MFNNMRKRLMVPGLLALAGIATAASSAEAAFCDNDSATWNQPNFCRDANEVVRGFTFGIGTGDGLVVGALNDTEIAIGNGFTASGARSCFVFDSNPNDGYVFTFNCGKSVRHRVTAIFE